MNATACFMLGAVMLAAGSDRGNEDMVMAVGQSRVLRISKMKKVAVGQAGIADVKVVSDNEVLISAKNPGVTSLVVWKYGGVKQNREIRVLKRNLDVVKREILDLLGPDSQVTIRKAGTRLVLEGTVMSMEHSGSINLIAQAYPEVLNLVHLSPLRRKILVSDLSHIIGMDSVHVRTIGERVILEGLVPSESKAADIRTIVSSYFPDAVDLLKVVNTRTVHLSVQISEVSSSSNMQGGMFWDTQSGSDLHVAGPVRAKGLFMKVKALEKKGRAKVLARPSLVTLSGEKAEFSSGGQIPYPVISQGESGVNFKSWGVHLGILPIVDDVQHVIVSIDAGISYPDQSSAMVSSAGMVPGISTRRVSSKLHVKPGDIVVLGGLLRSEESSYVEKIPLLGDFPVLGMFFRCRTVIKTQTEMVIFIKVELDK